MQNKGKWLKNKGGHLLGHSIQAPPGVRFLDTGTLQDTGHLLGGGVSVVATLPLAMPRLPKTAVHIIFIPFFLSFFFFYNALETEKRWFRCMFSEGLSGCERKPSELLP
jgi:hypothetical protein